MLAWDRTPGELLEYIRAWRDRREQEAYMLFNLAGTIAHMCFGSRPLRPEEAFPGVIRPRENIMTGDEIYASCLAWCAVLGGKEDADERGETE